MCFYGVNNLYRCNAHGKYNLACCKYNPTLNAKPCAQEDEPKYMVFNARQRASLLNSTKATSSDYNAVKALVTGQLNSYLGFEFIRSERIGVDANSDDKVLFFAKSGIKLGVGVSPKTKIGERADKNYATQVYTCMTIGATRMEEAKVGYVECDASAGPGA